MLLKAQTHEQSQIYHVVGLPLAIQLYVFSGWLDGSVLWSLSCTWLCGPSSWDRTSCHLSDTEDLPWGMPFLALASYGFQPISPALIFSFPSVLVVVVAVVLVADLSDSFVDCSLLGSSVHGVSQARILAWVAISFSRGSSWPRDQIHISRIGR